MWWPYIIGYFFATVIAHFPTKWVVDEMWKSIGWTKENGENLRAHSWQPSVVGIVERSLYVVSFQLGKPEFIGVWLALKVAGHWKRWGEDMKYDGHTIPGRSIYNIFLTGSALSIGYGIMGAKLIEWMAQQHWAFVIVAPISLLLGTLVLWIWIRCYRPQKQ